MNKQTNRQTGIQLFYILIYCIRQHCSFSISKYLRQVFVKFYLILAGVPGVARVILDVFLYLYCAIAFPLVTGRLHQRAFCRAAAARCLRIHRLHISRAT